MNETEQLSKPPKRRMVFIGDSITAGDGDNLAHGWPARLCVQSGLTDIQMHCYNLGVGGERIAHIHARWEAETLARLSGKTGGALIFMMGLNDALKGAAINDKITFDRAEKKNMLSDIFSRAKQLYPTLLIEPTPVHEQLVRKDGATGDQVNALVLEICDLLREVASDLNLPLIRLAEKLMDNKIFKTALHNVDNLHPSAKGYDEIADTIAKDPTWQTFIS